MASTVHVANISPQTTESQVHDFFSFCGKITSLKIHKDASGSHQSADVSFEKPTAAKTALLLDHTQLGTDIVTVTAPGSMEEMSAPKTDTATGVPIHDEVDQEDKPRSRIIAEYLAHGYTISDKAIERAIALDSQHGVSTKFSNALKNFDNKYKASEKAAQYDTKYGVSEKAMTGWRGMNSYFEKALGTPSGQKVRSFYLDGHKQVMDVHSEARRLADLKSGKTPTTASGVTPESADMHTLPGTDQTQCNCGAELGKCPCEPGKCACAKCPKNQAAGTGVTGDATMIEKMGMHTVGEGRTACSCGGDMGTCPCEPGKCACSTCAKNPGTLASATNPVASGGLPTS